MVGCPMATVQVTEARAVPDCALKGPGSGRQGGAPAVDNSMPRGTANVVALPMSGRRGGGPHAEDVWLHRTGKWRLTFPLCSPVVHVMSRARLTTVATVRLA
jgi:hypothetical protein